MRLVGSGLFRRPGPRARAAAARPRPGGTATSWRVAKRGRLGGARGAAGGRFPPALLPLSLAAEAVGGRDGPVKNIRSFLEFAERVPGASPE